MLGIILLSIAIIAYINKKRVLALSIFFTFTLEGFQVINNDISGVKLSDLAFIFVFVITIYNSICIPNYFKKSIFRKEILLFIGLLLISSIYSIIHYHFSLYQVFQASREYYIIFAYFFLIRLSPKEVYKLIHIFSAITIIIAIIYICQILIAKQPLLPYSKIEKIQFDPTTGLIRLYNFPSLLYFFLFLSFLKADYFKNKLIKGIFMLAFLCTLGRTAIAAVLLLLFMGIIITGKLKTNAKQFVIIGILMLPLAGIIVNRFNSGEQTSEDLHFILSGDITDMNMGDFTETGATLSYRLAWVYERLNYLIERNNSELYFGLGMISDNQPRAQKMYNFILGLNNEDTNTPFQLGTPDIAWGNILCRFGLIGIFFFAFYWFKIIQTLWTTKNMILFCGTLHILTYCLTSISSSTISYTTFMTFSFLLMALKENKSNKSIKLISSNHFYERRKIINKHCDSHLQL